LAAACKEGGRMPGTSGDRHHAETPMTSDAVKPALVSVTSSTVCEEKIPSAEFGVVRAPRPL